MTSQEQNKKQRRMFQCNHLLSLIDSNSTCYYFILYKINNANFIYLVIIIYCWINEEHCKSYISVFFEILIEAVQAISISKSDKINTFFANNLRVLKDKGYSAQINIILCFKSYQHGILLSVSLIFLNRIARHTLTK